MERHRTEGCRRPRRAGTVRPVVASAPTRRRPRPAPRRRRRTLSGRSGRFVLLGLILLAVFVVLLVGAFSSTPTLQVPKYAGKRPLPQIVAREGDLQIQLPISQPDFPAIGYHGPDAHSP